MRLVKMLCLASIATVAVIAIAGVPSAIAGNTLLCQKNTESLTPTAGECEPVAELHLITVSSKGTEEAKGSLLSSIFNVECKALVTAKEPSAGLAKEGPVTFSNVVLSYSSCNFCTTTVVTQGTISIQKTGAELGLVTATGFVVKVNCPFFFDCDYNPEGLAGHMSAGPEGKAHVTYSEDAANLAQDLKALAGSCPEVALLDALFQSLSPIYLRDWTSQKIATMLCENNTEALSVPEAQCKAPKTIHFLSVNGGSTSDAKVTVLASTNVECEMLLAGQLESFTLVTEGGVKFSANLTTSFCTPGCAITVTKQGTISFQKTGKESADVLSSGYELRFKCSGFNCHYSWNGVGHGVGAAEAGTGKMGHITYSGQSLNLILDLEGVSGSCPSVAKLDGLFKSLTPFYIRS